MQLLPLQEVDIPAGMACVDNDEALKQGIVTQPFSEQLSASTMAMIGKDTLVCTHLRQGVT